MTIDEQIEFLTQLKAGKKVQYRPIGRTDVPWVTPDPGLVRCNFAVWEYRVKPEPKVIFVNEYEDPNDTNAHPTKERAILCAHPHKCLRKAVKYVEVI